MSSCNDYKNIFSCKRPTNLHNTCILLAHYFSASKIVLYSSDVTIIESNIEIAIFFENRTESKSAFCQVFFSDFDSWQTWH